MSEQNLQVCRFCQRNAKLAYYCENCGTSCCSDCLDEEKADSYLCQDCHSKNIEFIDEEKKVCKECNKENIVKVTQHIKSCPKCHSHNIVNIFEKKEKLDQNFLELVTNSRTFIKPFKDVINKLYLFREKIKKARNPPIKCYHFPKMESDLLSLFKLILYLEKTLLEKVSIHFHHLSLNKEYFFSIYKQPNENVRIIEGILDNLNRSFESIEEFVEDNVNTIVSDTRSIEKNLKFVDKITDYFMQYKRFLSLADNEKPIYAISAKLSNGLNNQEIFKKKNGMLFITNLDLSFIHEYGWLKTKQDLIFKAPVSDLIRIKEKGKIFKKLYIEFSYGKYEFSLPDNDAISRVIEYILLARNYDETAIFDKESSRKLNNIEISLKKLKNFIEEGINSFYSLKCQSNNNINDNREQYNIENPLNSNPWISNDRQINDSNQRNFNPFYHNRYPNNLQGKSNTYYQKNPGNDQFHGYNPQIAQEFQNPNPNYSNNRNLDYNDQRYRNMQSKYNENEFFLQNLFNPNRFQNYNPDQLMQIYRQREDDFDKKAFLMKQLEKQQKFGSNNFTSSMGNHPALKNFVPDVYNSDLNIKGNRFQDYNKNHLSEFFESNRELSESDFGSGNTDFTIKNNNYKKKLQDLNREKFSLNETLNKLEDKFDQGIITEVDYFRTFKNLKKEIYEIEKNIKILEKKIRKDESIKRIGRQFDKRKYYT